MTLPGKLPSILTNPNIFPSQLQNKMERFETKFHPHQIQHPHQVPHPSARRLSLGPAASNISQRRASTSNTGSAAVASTSSTTDFSIPQHYQQHRRASGLTLLYKPNKPDIDLVRDFKQSLNAPINPMNQGRKHSSPCITLPMGGSGFGGGPSTLHAFGESSSTQRRRNSSFVPLPTATNSNQNRPDLDL